MNKFPPLYRDWGFWIAVAGFSILLAVLVFEVLRVIRDLGLILGLVGVALTVVGTITAASRRSVAALYEQIDSRLSQVETRLTSGLQSNRAVLEEILITLRERDTRGT